MWCITYQEVLIDYIGGLYSVIRTTKDSLVIVVVYVEY